ncbi:progestin and adipoQ receptor family member 3a isoform X2 [Dunckerocampus dactyliophorus]|uniref:progestin and adipoQ receptor family member 3a isoform X2 n=1 Tax=Dunckerocampus dactyliophorus TaxID=161453 RepID=UPI002405C28A|nr:progestin and adipoQ receptor family member 3a isoform X2 [Dunckerocampus dactyliophorus]
MPQKVQKNSQTAHYIELGGYQYWPVLVPSGIRLYTYEQIPGFLRENPYITDGYRAYLPSRLCIKSLFVLSNETVNIWSHLLGFLLFFCLAVYNMACVLPDLGASREDYVIYSIGLFCVKLCLLCSVGYHLFCCHRSEKTSRRWMALDYAGVSIGILGCYVPGVFYTFYCNNIHPHYLGKQWKKLRSLIFCSVACYGLVPTVHWICIDGGFTDELVQVSHAGRPSGTHPGRQRRRHLSGLCSPRAAHVFDGGVGARVLRVQSTRTLLPRPAELPGLQPPGVARAAAAHVLLVAPVVVLHHGVPTQPAVPGRRHALVAAPCFSHVEHLKHRSRFTGFQPVTPPEDAFGPFLAFHVENMLTIYACYGYR